jgi:hypothetical protein
MALTSKSMEVCLVGLFKCSPTAPKLDAELEPFSSFSECGDNGMLNSAGHSLVCFTYSYIVCVQWRILSEIICPRTLPWKPLSIHDYCTFDGMPAFTPMSAPFHYQAQEVWPLAVSGQSASIVLRRPQIFLGMSHSVVIDEPKNRASRQRIHEVGGAVSRRVSDRNAWLFAPIATVKSANTQRSREFETLTVDFRPMHSLNPSETMRQFHWVIR